MITLSSPQVNPGRGLEPRGGLATLACHLASPAVPCPLSTAGRCAPRRDPAPLAPVDPLMMPAPIERIFIGWDAPALATAAGHLIDHYSTGGVASLDVALGVLPGG